MHVIQYCRSWDATLPLLPTMSPVLRHRPQLLRPLRPPYCSAHAVMTSPLPLLPRRAIPHPGALGGSGGVEVG